MISFDLKVFKRNLHLHEKRVDIELVSNICMHNFCCTIIAVFEHINKHIMLDESTLSIRSSRSYNVCLLCVCKYQVRMQLPSDYH